MQALKKISSLPYNAIPFDQIKEEDFIPALKDLIAASQVQLSQYKKETQINYQKVIESLEDISAPIDYISNIFHALYSAEATEKLQACAQEFSTLLTQYSNSITLDEEIFLKIKKLHDQRDNHLNAEQDRILQKYYSDFVRNGALLNDNEKEKLKKIDEELSITSLKYSDNLLKATKAYELLISDEAQLSGLPSSAKQAAHERAHEKGKEGWLFSLDHSSAMPIFKYAQNRELRRKLYTEFAMKATSGEFDNSQYVKRIAELRMLRAQLLGYKTHAHFVLEKRMAKEPKVVYDFLDNLFQKSYPSAKKDLEKVKEIALREDKISDFSKWDFAYYSEKLKMAELSFDDEMLKPYFPMNKVIEGVFLVAEKLFGLEFAEQTQLPKYHPDVKIYKVSDKATKNYIGLFYTDFFPRETKRQGAWMTNLFDQGLMAGEVKRPHVSIVCNFTKPLKDKPSLLTINEVSTLFHEFGHALHGLLSNCHYRTLSGTNVYWDFVELPSQIMENWVKEKECLDLFAAHFETHEKIPQNLIDKIVKSQQFMEGWMTLKQVSFGLLDFKWHDLSDMSLVNDVWSWEDEAMKKTSLLQKISSENMSCSFSHLFSGGYSAGYYSYKWAEVLDADAFELFKEKGIFNQEISSSFRKNILEKGGSEDPTILYKRFRGKEPSVEPLMRRAGF